MEYVLQTRGLTKKFGRKLAVCGINMNVRKGDIYGFIGRNGAGKTTFIRMVSGLARPTSGSISLFESGDIDRQRHRLGTMIENPAVFPHMTARDNLRYYCRLLSINENIIDEMLALVGLSDTGRKKAKNFSLGMKQRLAIANILGRLVEPSSITVVDSNTIHIGRDLDKAAVFTSELAPNGVMVSSCTVIGQDLEAYFMYLCDKTDKRIS